MAKHLTILVAEDNPGDVFLIKRILSKLFFEHTLAIANDGEEALDYLNKCLLEEERHTRPDFILLDLNLPKIDGRELLVHIKNHQKLKTIPVIMFSSSQAPEDISAAYLNQANCYVVKPYDLDEYNAVLENICRFWGDTVNRAE